MGAMLRLLSLRRAKSLRRPGPQGHETAVPVSSGSRQPVGTSHSVSTIQGEKDEAHLIPAHVVLATLVHRQLLPAVLAVRSAAQLPQTPATDAAVQEQEKIVCLTLDLIHSLGFDEEDCLKVLRGFIRAIDGHGRSEYSARGQDVPSSPQDCTMVRPQALFATPPVKGSADSGAFYATSNQICATPLRDATPGSLCAPLGSPESPVTLTSRGPP